MKVYLSTHLRSYTNKQSVVEAEGETLSELLADMNRRYPGFRFRIVNEQDEIRDTIKIFIDEEYVRSLNIPLAGAEKVHIIGALSGGVSWNESQASWAS